MKKATVPPPSPPRRAARSRAALKMRSALWAAAIGAAPRRLQVQPMRKKWASCSTRGTITLSADLLFQDAEFQEAVVVHELLHLLVPNHGPVFRSLMRAYLPDLERVMKRRGGSCGLRAQ